MSEVVRDTQTLAGAKRHILDRLGDGRFVPRVAKTFPLEQTAGAYRYLAANEQVGRVVVLNA